MRDIQNIINDYHDSQRLTAQQKKLDVERKTQAKLDLKCEIQSLVSLVSVSGERVFTSVLKEHVSKLAIAFSITEE